MKSRASLVMVKFFYEAGTNLNSRYGYKKYKDFYRVLGRNHGD